MAPHLLSGEDATAAAASVPPLEAAPCCWTQQCPKRWTCTLAHSALLHRRCRLCSLDIMQSMVGRTQAVALAVELVLALLPLLLLPQQPLPLLISLVLHLRSSAPWTASPALLQQSCLAQGGLLAAPHRSLVVRQR
jgi:hypothetical protein